VERSLLKEIMLLDKDFIWKLNVFNAAIKLFYFFLVWMRKRMHVFLKPHVFCFKVFVGIRVL
jgi:hypothetical protein